MFFLLGISVAVFLEFLLLIKKNKSRADYILALWLLVMAVHQIYFYAFITGAAFNYPHLLGVEFPMPVLHGVLLYFYVLEITGKRRLTFKFSLLNLLPAISLIVLAIPFFMLTGEEKIYVFENEGIGFEWYVLYKEILVIVSGLFYVGLSLMLILKHQKDIQQTFSNTDKRELQWLKYLTIGLGLIWVLVIFFSEVAVFSGVVIFVLFIGGFGINQLNIFKTDNDPNTNSNKIDTKQQENKPQAEETPITPKRYAKSGLNEAESDRIYSTLNQVMDTESLYINSDLTLTDVAGKLDVHPNHLSQVINEREQKNFYNYINALRIQSFLKQDDDKREQFTLLSLAYDAGFNSKSTFNKHFKLNTGKTPTQYFAA